MSPALRDEIRQTRPFHGIEHEAELNIVRTAALLQAEFDQLAKGYGLSAPQYNVLRILRGAEPEGLCRNEIRDRMVTRMPDVTRLLDRMESAGLVSRSRGTEDRREVNTRITREGRKLVDEMDDVVDDLHRRQLAHMSRTELRTLIELLTRARLRR